MTSADTERALALRFRVERFTAAQRLAGDPLAALRVRVRDVALMREIGTAGPPCADAPDGMEILRTFLVIGCVGKFHGIPCTLGECSRLRASRRVRRLAPPARLAGTPSTLTAAP